VATRDAQERGGEKKGIACMSKVNSNREETAVKYSTVITEDTQELGKQVKHA
jgi:hypothetical protein